MNIKSPMKTANQKWAFVSLEVPHHTWGYYRQKQCIDKFDWTMTYRSDSEDSQFLCVYAFLFTQSGGAYHNIVKF
jgi:hypothetical protein